MTKLGLTKIQIDCEIYELRYARSFRRYLYIYLERREDERINLVAYTLSNFDDDDDDDDDELMAKHARRLFVKLIRRPLTIK